MRFPQTRLSAHVGLRAAMAAATLFVRTADAQVFPRAEHDPAQRLIQEQRNRERQRELEHVPPQISAPEPPRPASSVDADIETLPDVEPTFRIDTIELAGNTMLSTGEVDRITRPFSGKKLGANRINLLLRRFTEAFVDKGLITTRAYLGAQNLGSGVLTVTVIPGTIEAIRVNGRTLRPQSEAVETAVAGPVNGGLLTDLGTLRATPAKVGQVLDLSDLEQGVDQINRLRRNQAEMQILPGTTPGGSIVSLTNKPGDRFRFSAGTDNYGSGSTGVTRVRLGLDGDNLLGFQEAMSINYSGSANTNAVIASAAIPWGYHVFSYTASLSEFQNLIGDTALMYGRAMAQTLGWNTVLGRSRSGKTAADVTLTRRKSERSINEFQLDPQWLTVLRIGLNRLQRFTFNGQQCTWTMDAGISRGLNALDANMDSPDIHASEAHSQFTKFDGAASATLPLGKTGNTSWIWRGQFAGQWSRQALFGSEQVYAGGTSSVRGFREGGISGDRGFYIRNDLIWSPVPEWHGIRSEPYAFLDAGRTQLIARAKYEQVAGAGLGVRFSAAHGKHALSSELLVGHPLRQPRESGKKKTIVSLSLNWTY